MKTVSELLDELLYNRNGADPGALYYRSKTGVEYEVEDALFEELTIEYGHSSESYLFDETGFFLDEFIQKNSRST